MANATDGVAMTDQTAIAGEIIPAKPHKPLTPKQQQQFNLVCERIMEGMSLRAACKLKDSPTDRTIARWLDADEANGGALCRQYMRAREAAADAVADEIIDIADNATNDWMKENDPDNPGYSLNGEHVQRSRLRIDTRKWVASKLKPKRYGDFKPDVNVAVGVTVEFIDRFVIDDN